MTGQPKRSVSTERSWTRRQLSGDIGTPPLGMKKISATAAVGVPLRQRSRTPILRPLSHSKSMLALTTKGRELAGRNNGIDDIPRNKNSLQNLEEESSHVKGRQQMIIMDSNDDQGDIRSADGDLGIII
eukprot:CAMPEP_0201209072 /NCGR_PEP_ID=MMETSP0851-20130426/177575_1 /ASSEMBLY_ACC=CAM_ASM_000631 /TAXON_ID=183588 /ORGANISM="Pseudo-nitzschia fraudulenta, Strain WWA7" /LENGTH=128 /DNA_ID=CAMNT_0047497699 /DNA_START=8 /DNA_END=394 /DNA_ORIENTATION=+